MYVYIFAYVYPYICAFMCVCVCVHSLIAVLPVGAQIPLPPPKAIDYLAKDSVSGMENLILNC